MMLRTAFSAAAVAMGGYAAEAHPLLEESRSTLSAAQQQRLEGILSGDVDKTQVEIVLARFDEDLEWSDLYSSITTVYNKGKPLSTGKYDAVPLENKGREGHT
jgi:hypothetical protein